MEVETMNERCTEGDARPCAVTNETRLLGEALRIETKASSIKKL
jgi:hypothetical protein